MGAALGGSCTRILVMMVVVMIVVMLAGCGGRLFKINVVGVGALHVREQPCADRYVRIDLILSLCGCCCSSIARMVITRALQQPCGRSCWYSLLWRAQRLLPSFSTTNAAARP